MVQTTFREPGTYVLRAVASDGSLFTYEYNDKVYTKHEFHSFATSGLNASFDGTTAWTP